MRAHDHAHVSGTKKPLHAIVGRPQDRRNRRGHQYVRAVQREGNRAAQRIVTSVFEVCDRKWRGVGPIPQSGYRLRPEFRAFDAEEIFKVGDIATRESPVCISGLILQGIKKPHDCPAFGTSCTPQNPLGATMVSAEGACAAYYAYGRHLKDADNAAALK